MTVDPDVILARDHLDIEALAASILHRYYTSLHYLAYSILNDADEADDAVQDVVITAIDRIDRYKPGSNMKAWLSTITINKCRDMRRGWGSRDRLINTLSSFLTRQPMESPERSTERGETRSELWLEVDKLKDKHRIPLILRYVHSYSVGEIAELLEVKEGTVYSRLHYGCKQLGQQLSLGDREGLIKEFLDA